MSQPSATLPPGHPWPHGIDPMGAVEALRGTVLRTPVRRLPWLERLVGVPVWAKLESQQHTGSFKYRGAYLAMLNAPAGPVIAASAGNHGLAVAEVARLLGRRANICVPVVASRLKRERILSTGAGLIEHGNGLEDATEHAQKLAETHRQYYISPYNNPDVISGASTIGVELLADVPSLQTIIAPVGGGGLISGLAIGAAAAGKEVEVIGCEPQRYASMTASLDAGEIVRVVHQPTFADGLAVNLEAGSITFPLVRHYVSDTILLSEEEMAAGTYALLVHESLLVEPAGAAAVIACLRLGAQGRLTGPVGIPLCGGNVQHGALSRIQRFPFIDPDLIRLLDLRGRAVADLPVVRARQVAPDDRARASVSMSDGQGKEQEQEQTGDRHGGPDGRTDLVAQQVDDLVEQLDRCAQELRAARKDIDEYTAYCARNRLVVDESVIDQLTDAAESTVDRLTRQRYTLLAHTGRDLAEHLTRGEVVLRFGLATLTHVRGTLEWCSPSYAQSRAVQFFNTGAQDSPTVNYERYENVAVQGVEGQLLDVLGLPPDTHAVSVTSSGMAAYSLVESFLLRARLAPGDTVLLAPYIYFEAAEQLTALPFLRFERAASYGTDDIIAGVVEHQPRCVFVDPVANTAQQRMVDLIDLLRRLRSVVTRPTTVIIDGTMASGALPAGTLASDEQVEVLYYESCSKYLQLGLDAGMAGLVAYPVGLRPHLERLRRNTGSILYRHHAELFPRFGRAFFRRRMQRISANALRVTALLHDDPRVSNAGRICYPNHPSHPDFQVARTLPYTGGCVTFLFHDPGRNHRDELEPLIDHMLAAARGWGLPLTKGVSFGFSVPRISAAASMAETEPPFLRLYVGDRGGEQVDLLAETVAQAISG